MAEEERKQDLEAAMHFIDEVNKLEHRLNSDARVFLGPLVAEAREEITANLPIYEDSVKKIKDTLDKKYAGMPTAEEIVKKVSASLEMYKTAFEKYL